MFEEICLVCGKHLLDDGRAYCSDDCQHSDLSSPSISSSSSALSSPNMTGTAGGDVPPLMPSALGSALRVYAARSSQYVSSSSASSTSWSVITDEEDEDAHSRFHEYNLYPEDDTASKSANFIYTLRPGALSYARRPSGTNNHSTVPHVHRRLSSGSSSGHHVRGIPSSAPMLSHAASQDDDESYSEFSFMTGDALDIDDTDLHSEKDWASDPRPKYSGATKPKRTRNRASLPACFSLLQMSSLKKESRGSDASSSGNTIARPSPPTPKISIASTNGLSQVRITPSIPLTSVHDTPRGRRREADNSRSSRRSGLSSASRSRSRSRRVHTEASPRLIDSVFRSRDTQEDEEVDWETAPLRRRGRESVRRNSSPPPRIIMGVEPAQAFLTGWRAEEDADRSRSGSDSRQRERGRARIEGGMSSDAPGYGNGRSGLVDRERERERGAGIHMARVPV